LTCVVCCCCESELGNRSTSHPSPNRGGPTLHRLRLSPSRVNSQVKLARGMTLVRYLLYCLRAKHAPMISQLFQMFLQHCVWLYFGVLCVGRTRLVEIVTASAESYRIPSPSANHVNNTRVKPTSNVIGHNMLHGHRCRRSYQSVTK
jgi:hypothetical protein